MKKFAHALCFALLSVGLLLVSTACEVERMSSLKDVSHPYAGTYACEELTVGGKDLRDKFASFTLELGTDGDFVALYRTEDGREGSYGGAYEIDPVRGEITFSAVRGGREKTFTFPYEKGTIRCEYNLYGSLVHARFKKP